MTQALQRFERSERSERFQRFEQLLPFYLNGTLAQADRLFVQDFLRLNPDLHDSLLFSGHLQQAVRALAPVEQPDPQRIHRLLGAWAQSRPHAKPMPVRHPWFRGLVMAFSGMGLAALAATLVFGVNALPLGLLHGDGLDGQPDVQLVLADGIDPSHEMLMAQLERHQGVIVNQSELQGRYVIEVDLHRRAASQQSLIQSLQESGHIDGYTLLASR